jgi:transcriptional regulator with XRE-family HTH domain
MSATGVHYRQHIRGMVLADITCRFGERLRAVRKEKGTTQEKLAENAGLSRNYVNDVERGRRNVTIRTVESLARALGVRMADLMPD